ncbi:hypothetical protein QFZ24_000054 [Streptomyces phaeochromogenes]|nr:hypothetical protein [Streptomyces phaeochromogenes]
MALTNFVPMREVSRWLGHRSIEATVDFHGHLVPRACHRCWQVLQIAMPGLFDLAAQPLTEPCVGACTKAA